MVGKRTEIMELQEQRLHQINKMLLVFGREHVRKEPFIN